IAGQRGERVIPIQDFFVNLLETALQPGELLVEIRVTRSHQRRSAHFVKFSSLAANDWPCVGVAAVLEWPADDLPLSARLGVTAMAAVPLLVEVDAAGLERAALAEAAVEAILAAADPVSDLRGSANYKRRVCAATRSEERRVGKEWGGGGAAEQ